MILLTQEPLKPGSLTSKVTSDRNGAVITFLGNTRRFNGDKEVLFLEYEAYEPMALKELQTGLIINKIDMSKVNF